MRILGYWKTQRVSYVKFYLLKEGTTEVILWRKVDNVFSDGWFPLFPSGNQHKSCSGSRLLWIIHGYNVSSNVVTREIEIAHCVFIL